MRPTRWRTCSDAGSGSARPARWPSTRSWRWRRDRGEPGGGRRDPGGGGVTATADPLIATEAADIARRSEAELEALVNISSPSGDVDGAERALALCASLLPDGARVQRPPCSTAGSAPDLIATVTGTGAARVMLLGHVDTVIGHDAHQALRRYGERLYGTGTVDMKGGDILALGVARALARRPD